MNMNAFRRGLAAAALLLSMLAAGASAQEFRGSLAGSVTDPNGAALPGVTVEIRNVETNTANTATTNEEGAYAFPLLQPGRYTLTATSQGFNTEARENLVVNVADKLTLDITMTVGVSETVTTVAAAETLETGSVSTGTVITSQQISELPLAEGTAYQLATLAPGVSYTGNPQFTGPTSNGNLAAFRSNGATGGNQITLDGSPNYAFDGGVGFSPPSDAVEQFKVQTSQFDAQQGYTAGATVNVAIKSGTNDLHGSLYYFNRDRSRTANNFFNNRNGDERPERTYHRFGGVVNGPVYIPGLYNGRDKTFFLFSYERLKDNIAEPETFSVPTERMRAGDFTELLSFTNPTTGLVTPIRIFDPFAVTSGNATTVVRSQVQCNGQLNVICANRLNPVAQALLSYYPLPNIQGARLGQDNYFSNQIRRQNYRAWLTRFDHRISDTKTIFGKFFHSFNPEDRLDWAGVVNNVPITQGFEYRTNDGGSIDYTQTVSSSLVLDIRASFNRFVQERRPAVNFDPASLGFTAAAVAPMRGYQYLPRFDLRNFDTIGSERSDFNEGRLRPFYMGSVQPTITQIFGNHTAKYGYDFRVIREHLISNGYQGGRFFFDGTFTTLNSTNSTTVLDRDRAAYGRDLAAFLFGVPSASATQSLIDNPINYSVQSVYHGFFFQDDWRITPKLTLNMGLRYDLETGLTERFNRLARGFDTESASPVDAQARTAYAALVAANPGVFPLAASEFRVTGGFQFADENNRSLWESDKGNLQPRFGVAYQVSDKTVLRGGFGLFMAPFQVPSVLADTDNRISIQPGFSGSTLFNPSTNNGRTFIATLNNPFPSGVAASPGAGLGLLTNVGGNVGAQGSPVIGTDRKNSKFARFVLGFQHELPSQFVVEANYVSSWGYDLAVSRNINFVPRSFLGTDAASNTAQETFLTFDVPNPFVGLLANTGSTLNTAATVDRLNTLLPFPQFGNVWVEEYNGTNRYHSLQLQANKRFGTSNNTLTATYTWSRLRERVNYLNPSDTDFEDRISPFDRPHRVTFAGTYELPVGRGRWIGGEMNRLLDAFIGGWQLNGTYEWQSGEPFLLRAADSLFYPGDPQQLESRIGESDGQGGLYGIDRSAFINAAGLVRLNTNIALRNVPTTLDSVRNQPFLNVNLSLTKNFRIDETKRIQVRAEALNAFNTPYFGSGIGTDPGTNAASLNANFGFVTAQRNNPRDIQLGVKFTF